MSETFTVITITLQGDIDATPKATLTMQRNGLCHLRQFDCKRAEDIAQAIHQANAALAVVETPPPDQPSNDKPADAPAPAAKSTPADKSATTAETPPKTTARRKSKSPGALLEVNTQAGTVEIERSVLTIINGKSDRAAYRQAALAAGYLIDAGLWDGKTPIQLDGAYSTWRRLKQLGIEKLKGMALSDVVIVPDAV